MCELTDLVNEYEATRRWDAGELPCFSSNIVDQVTCGYGVLSPYGEWQFPLYPTDKYLRLTKKRRVDRGELPFVLEQVIEQPLFHGIE